MSNVAFYDGFYHFQRDFYIKNKKEFLVTCCGLHLSEDVVERVKNDPKVTIPHCLKCISNLMTD